MKQTIRDLYWKGFIARVALRWIPRLNLGDQVVFQGVVYRITQGVEKPFYDLSGPNGVRHVHQSHIRKVWSLGNLCGSFRHGWQFYMGYWFPIWRRTGIEPWMRRCRIWAR